ncbi:hypothetical protein J2S30_002571 [Herbaspirillum rubrisubalbicans]|uniref:hypothetical protein n=1 Tax=Herbaspirillum rubrisubalbicans TaxID=80842 RepID=UPI00209CBDE3|nr:hypothetical protein [Herbaspirillum rubrisubalbicans]MCP1574192.1 hypothetical protein [Herbaspirillum rubrisubalbicans]
MFGDGEGLNAEVKFAVAAAYDKFHMKWGLNAEKLRWVEIWSAVLSKFSTREINEVAAYCLKEFRRPPVPVEYIELCTRYRNGLELSAPIVSTVERMAYLILANEDFQMASSSDIARACVIAAAVSTLKTYEEFMPNTPFEYIKHELVGEAQMFIEEANRWHMDAKDGKGYWKDFFLNGSTK